MVNFNKINVAIIGFGRMGITHYSIINSHPSVELKAVVDTSSTILSLLKKYTGTKSYNDYRKLFRNETLDAVIICTPPKLHYQIAMMAAENNIHVFLEKPCTLKREMANELSIVFEDKGLVNQVGYVNRFNDIFIEVRHIINKKVIGDVIRFKSEMYSGTILKSDSGSSWRDSSENGGGATYDMAAHAIDLVNYFVGKPDKITGASLTKIFSKNVEDSVNATFLYKNRFSGTLDVNWSDESYRKPTNKIEIFGTKGKVIADQHGLKIYLMASSSDNNMLKGWNTVYITDVFKSVPFYVRGNEFTTQLYHFIECIQNNDIINICTFNDASETLGVIEEIFNDFESNGVLK